MISDNYFLNHQHDSDLTSYEEQLLLNYDNYLEGNSPDFSLSDSHYGLELSDLQDEYLEDDFDSEYDENDWEEED
ncbi:hypothetical protein K6T82_11560 [Flavobacterium sp. 17A]|uniref:Uncharacterized protein n=1 Tax=Flavobacterium potami TaxID=2872310 RepID=A0A9X1KRM8_9FLAO|nr:hypothetical protein [Flavobacterium potami]MBZ4035406.1 hypothetical protein [Flavobacterium potami]